MIEYYEDPGRDQWLQLEITPAERELIDHARGCWCDKPPAAKRRQGWPEDGVCACPTTLSRRDLVKMAVLAVGGDDTARRGLKAMGLDWDRNEVPGPEFPPPERQATPMQLIPYSQWDEATRRRGVQSTLRQVEAAAMFSRGSSYQDIADTLGFRSAAAAKDAVTNGTRKMVRRNAEHYITSVLEEHMKALEAIQETIDHPGYLYDVKGGLLAGPDGEFEVNKAERTKALTEQRKTLESVRRLLGLDEPQKKQITTTAITVEIEQMARLLQEQLQLPPGDVVDAVVVSQDGQEQPGGDGDDAGGVGPGRSGSESPQQAEQDRGDVADDGA